MLMTAVIQPDAFDQSNFLIPGYRDQVEMLLRGLASNGLVLCDPNCKLLRELNKRVESLGTKVGQQIQIRLAELQKSSRRRVIIADRSACSCPTSLGMLDSCCTVHSSLKTDTLIVDSATLLHLQTKANAPKDMTPLSAYISSDFERKRHYCLDEVPPIDQMAPGEFDEHLIRITRFSKRLVFYDKQIGNGSSLGGFRTGIGRILTLWVKNAHFPRSSLTTEIYTCGKRTHETTEVIYNRILNNLVRRLSSDSGVPVKLYFKQDTASLTHDRFLQTDSIIVSFSKGFDYMEENGTLHRCAIKIDNGAYAHLQEYRTLNDIHPPSN
jgi:hypothetical protein